MRIIKSYSTSDKGLENLEKLKDMTLIKKDSELINLAIRFCLFRIKAFMKFLEGRFDG